MPTSAFPHAAVCAPESSSSLSSPPTARALSDPPRQSVSGPDKHPQHNLAERTPRRSHRAHLNGLQCLLELRNPLCLFLDDFASWGKKPCRLLISLDGGEHKVTEALFYEDLDLELPSSLAKVVVARQPLGVYPSDVVQEVSLELPHFHHRLHPYKELSGTLPAPSDLSDRLLSARHKQSCKSGDCSKARHIQTEEENAQEARLT